VATEGFRSQLESVTVHANIRTLLQKATASDLEATKSALALIVERGFHRNRGLLQDFEDLTKRFRS
jgi:hypothetical protein